MARAPALALLSAALAAAAFSSAASQPSAVHMQLHRLPGRATHAESYRRRRLIQSADEDDAAAPLEAVPLHIGLGTHYTWVYAGTPPQRASVIVDTGSGILAFPCSGCDGCGEHTDKPFNASDSSTLVHVTCAAHDYFKCQSCQVETDTCAISQAYMEGSSWEATVVEDIVFLGGDASFDNADARNQFGTHFKFGCQHAETGLFIEQVADGIMGLSNTDNHIIAKLHQENKIPNKIFSLCFAEDGGAMTIGEADTSRHRGDVRYAKLIGDRSSTNFYNVHVLDILIGGKSIEADPVAYTRGRFIVDSGTTDSYLPRAVKNEFMDAFRAASGLDYHVSSSSCKGYSAHEIETLPTVQFVLESPDGGNMTLDVSPSQYLLQGEDNYCGGIFLSEYSGGVIGANLMMNRDVIFDGGSQRVGFVDADCTYTAGQDAYLSSTSPSMNTPSSNPTSNAGEEEEEEEMHTVPVKTTAATSTGPTSEPTADTTPISSESEAPPAPASESGTPEATSSTPVTPSVTTSAAGETTAPAETTATPVEVPIATISTIVETPEPETVSNTTLDAATAQGTDSSGSQAPENHPMVLTIVGTVLAVAFLLIVFASMRVKRNRKKKQNWSRVNEDEEEEEDEELGLVEAQSKRGKTKGKPKHQPLAATADAEDDDDDDDDGSSEDEDEIFDRQTQDHASKHDAKMLEQL